MRYFFCPKCGHRHSREDSEIPAAGVSVPCQKCGTPIPIKGRPGSGTHAAATAKTSTPPVVESANSEQASSSRSAMEGKSKGKKKQPEPEASPPAEDHAAQDAPPAAQAEATGKPPEVKKDPRVPSALGKNLSGAVDRWLGRIGTGRSGESFRFRDLFFALVVPLDPRKLLLVALSIFLGSLGFWLMTFLGSLTEIRVGFIFFLVLGGLLFWACLTLGLGAATFLADKEMRAGKHDPCGAGVSFMTSTLTGRWLAILGTPFAFVVLAVVFTAGVAALSWMGKIPYVGPVAYGLSYVGTLVLALGAVMIVIALVIVSFSYLPVVNDPTVGPVSGARRSAGFVLSNPGRYMLHLLIATAISMVLLFLLSTVAWWAFRLIFWVAGTITEQDLGSIFGQVPMGMIGLTLAFLPGGTWAFFGAERAAEFPEKFGGWMVGLSSLFLFSMVLAFALLYL